MGRTGITLGRREFVWTSLLLPAALRAAQTGDEVEARVARVIAEYDSQGPHRTGTDVDNRSGQWLLDRAREAGADASLEAFALDRVDVRSAFVQAEGRRVEGLPLFDGGLTDAEGLAGVLGPAGGDGAVALLTVDQAGISSEGQSIADVRRSPRHRAIVVVTEGAQPGLTPMNAAVFSEPFGAPTLQVGSGERAWLEDLARRRAEVRVVAEGVRTPATAANVVATVHGRQPDRRVVVVITPRSGWWACAAERGGGLVCWLEAIRMVARARAPRTTLFVASSGHELGHLGLKAFLASRPGLVADAVAFVHLGANIGAQGGRPRLQASDARIEALAGAALSRAGVPVSQRVRRGSVPAGEAHTIHVGGGRYVSLLGSSPFFHSQVDRWPASVDASAVRRYSEAFGDLTATLASGWQA
jgi:hypothetical protein